MSTPISFDHEGDIIDITPKKPRRRKWKWLILVAIVVLFFGASRAVSIYLSAAWFGSLGYASIFWFIFKAKLEIFLAGALTSPVGVGRIDSRRFNLRVWDARIMA